MVMKIEQINVKLNKNTPYKRESSFFLALFSFTWEQREAKELCQIGTGKSNTQDQNDEGDYPFFIRSDTAVKSNKYLYDCEAVITIGDGNIGRVFHYINGKFDLHQRCYKMTDFNDITGKYFYYFFGTKFYKRAMSMTAKATVDSVRFEMISEMPILYPKLKTEQEKIATIFSTLDNLITCHQRECEFLYIRRNSCYVRNSLIFTNTWEQRELGEVAEIVGGGTPSTTVSEYWNGDIDWYSPTEIGDNVYADNSQKKITKLGLEKSSAKMLPPNKTILFTSRAGIGDMAILKKEACTNQGFQSFVLKEEYNLYFIYSMGYKIKEQALEKSSGSTFLEISGKTLSKLNLNVTMELDKNNIAEQTQIGTFFATLDNLITCHQRKPIKTRRNAYAYRNNRDRTIP